MKLEDQVLTIEQVQELQKLGFDVRKHASLYFVEEKSFIKEKFIVLPEQIDITKVPEDVKITPTMTIGDILEILPIYIKDNRNNTYWRVINYNGVLYYRSKQVDWIFNTHYEKPNKPLIEALFEMLKWCIKEKHIALYKK